MRSCQMRDMADKGGGRVGTGVKPVPMKLFATWEIEKSSPNCIPRYTDYFYLVVFKLSLVIIVIF